MRTLRTFHWIAGAPILLAISLATGYAHLQEKIDRHIVLTEGRDAPALMRGALSTHSVAVEWMDAKGDVRTGQAWTGKPFARQFREQSPAAGKSVQIKYVDDPGLAPVIISEAAERERVNNWWISSSIGMSIVSSAICAALAFIYLQRRRQ